ncbi:MAG: HD domain-containing phosphohydrolase, partial [Candidatus Omnitrophota bacterium]
MLYSLGKWNVPGDFKDRDKAEGHICYDVIKRGTSDFLIIHNLEQTPYVKTDPNVTRYNLKTYVGKAVGLGKDTVGSLCVVYQDDHDFTLEDQRIMEIISLAIGVEEKRKQAEDELRIHRNNLEELVKERTSRIQELNRQTEFILGATKTGLDIIDSDFNIIYVDPAWQKVYGSPIGKKCYEYFMDRNSECPDCGIRKALETKTTIVTEETLKKENNRPIQVTTIPFQDKDGKWLVAEVNVDITERKKIEEQLDKYRKHLESLVKERTGKLELEIAQRKNTEEDKQELTKELIKTNKKLKQLALKDIHTGLFNHRYLEEIIDLEFHRAKRAYHPLSLILIDIDYFKSINDVYGHKFGDLVLKQFAIHLKKIVRRYDIIIRYGGEEFMILCPGTYRATALILAQRILDNIILENFGDGKYKVKMKLTLAVASYPEDKVVNGMGLVEIVDKIMNKAKEHGGNRIYSSLDIKKKTEIIGNNIEEKGNVKILKEKLEKITKRANQGLAESIFAFAKTIELKDHYTGEHVEKTVQYTTEIARVLGLSKDEVERIRQAAMVHDLGKIGISEKILLKKAKLTKKEFEVIKKHPQIGVDIIRPIQFLHDIIPLIFYHHERWDGKGYPSGLKGEEIPFGARIIALADVYQALTSNRPYRKAYSKQKALKIIKESSGSQFDPKVVAAFLK